jgi:hypothetical protein
MDWRLGGLAAWQPDDLEVSLGCSSAGGLRGPLLFHITCSGTTSLYSSSARLQHLTTILTPIPSPSIQDLQLPLLHSKHRLQFPSTSASLLSLFLAPPPPLSFSSSIFSSTNFSTPSPRVSQSEASLHRFRYFLPQSRWQASKYPICFSRTGPIPRRLSTRGVLSIRFPMLFELQGV